MKLGFFDLVFVFLQKYTQHDECGKVMIETYRCECNNIIKPEYFI